MVIDYFLNMIYLPVAVSQTYGFQSATEVFTGYVNETGFVSLSCFVHSQNES
jgi:hypothetical protein